MSLKRKSKAVQEHTKDNRDEVLASEVCGCINCCRTFSPDEIKVWAEFEDRHHHHKKERSSTAVCPQCGEAAVIGDRSGLAVSPATMEALRNHMRLS